MRRRLSVGMGVLLGTAAVVVPGGEADAVVCTIDELTETPAGRTSGGAVDIDATGDRIAFDSNATIGGANADLSTEVWTHQRIGPLVNPFSGGSGAAFSVSPSINGDGTLKVYSSTTNPVGTNADGNTELFVRDERFAITRQITTTTGGTFGNSAPSIDGDGDRIAFLSDRNLDGTNADGNTEVYLVSVFGPVALTVTTGDTISANNEPHISADGRFVAFATTRDLPGSGNIDGNREVVRLDLSTGTIVPITNSPGGGTGSVTIDGDGDQVAFVTNRNLTGGNADGGFDLFLRNLTTGTTTQLTNGGGTTSIGATSLAEDGSRITYLQSRNAEAAGGAGPEGSDPLDVHARDLPSGTLVRIAETDLGSSAAQTSSTNALGTRTAFSSLADYTGDNPEGNREVFRATCGRGAPVFSDVGTGNQFFQQVQWMSAATIAGGFPDGTFHPQEAVKRQQMAGFLFNASEQFFVGPGDPTFSDLPTSNPFFDEIEWMAAAEVAGGFPDGTFRPQDSVKRQQMANFLYNLAGEPFFVVPTTPTFSDVPTTSPFYGQIEWMVAEGIASGFPDGTFHPQEAVKRQQMANFLFNFIDQLDVEAAP